MIHIKVVYDKYNRTFKIVDKEMESLLTDGEVYELQVPIEIDGQPVTEDSFTVLGIPLAHA